MVNFTILAGGYDVFIAAYLFNSNTLSLTITSRSPTGNNPLWITPHPSNKSVLCAVNENAAGGLQSFSVTPEGVLTTTETISLGGDSPTFAITLSMGQVAIVNYNGANGRVVPTTSPLDFTNSATPIIIFPPPAGGVSHPHMVLKHASAKSPPNCKVVIS